MNWTDELAQTAQNADPVEAKPDAEQVVKDLAKLTAMEYDQCRKEEADRLGIRVATLDGQVARLCGGTAAPGGDTEDAPSIVEDLEPWPEAVPGIEIADEIRTALLRYVVFPSQHDADALTIWSLGTFNMDRWALWPKVLIRSPERRCGKSTLMEVLEGVTCRALLASSVTPSAIFRIIEACQPSLLIDEADRLARDDDTLIGIINSGHTRRLARVLRTVETRGGHEVKAFSTWAPMVIAGIGSQADTIVDRSIIIDLQRRLPSEAVEKRPADFFERTVGLRRKLMRWANDNGKRVAALDVEPPACGNDRAQDNWTPLFRVAAVLGGPRPERIDAAYAAKEFSVGDEDEPASVMLLRDLNGFFAEQNGDRLQTSDVVTWLNEMEDRPWPEWRRGQPMTAQSVSRQLKRFGIKPENMRVGTRVVKGYKRAPVEAAHARYCPASPSRPATPLQFNEANGLDGSKAATSTLDVAGRTASNPLKTKKCSDVTAGNNDAWEAGVTSPADAADDHDEWVDFE